MGEYDTVHTVELTDDGILINGQHLTFSATRDPKVIPWSPASKSEFDEINIFSAYTLNERANACVGSSNREAQGVLVPHFRHNDSQNTEKIMSVDSFFAQRQRFKSSTRSASPIRWYELEVFSWIVV